jgi:hypothetical protein
MASNAAVFASGGFRKFVIAPHQSLTLQENK